MILPSLFQTLPTKTAWAGLAGTPTYFKAGQALGTNIRKTASQIGKSKKKKVSESLDEASFADYMAQAQAARDRVKQKHDNRKKKDAAYIDRVKKGVKFYDKKGSGRLVKGKKVYD